MNKSLDDLAKEQERIDSQIAKYSLGLLRPFYDKRRQLIGENNCRDFWKRVFVDSALLDEYLSLDDAVALDELTDVFIEWDAEKVTDFTLLMSFDDNKLFDAITLRKRFVYHSEDDEEFYTSPDVQELAYKGEPPASEDTFFSFFSYTSSPRKKIRQRVFDIASIILSEIYPAALGLYKPSPDDVTDEYDISE